MGVPLGLAGQFVLGGQGYSPATYKLLPEIAIAAAVTGVLVLTTDKAGSWRPPGWNQKALYSITAPAAAAAQNPAGVSPANPTGTSGSAAGATADTKYFFDAVLRAEHRRELKTTEHPVQTGAVLTDHAYLLPAKITLEIGMSDAMQSYQTGQWSSDPSKSVSAFQTLLNLQKGRALLTLSTRLNTYKNVLIQSISAVESDQTRASLRATVTFVELFVATVTSPATNLRNEGLPSGSGLSLRPQLTNSTLSGAVAGIPPSQSVQQLFGVQPDQQIQSSIIGIPAYGTYGSNPSSLLSV